MIPFLNFDYQDNLFRKEMITAMTDVVDSKWYIMGQKLSMFEQEYAKAHNIGFAVGVANGLDALTIALKVLKVGPGDEVVVPSNTYIASWLAVSLTGATPVPVEPDPYTYNINPELIEEKISTRTKVIMPVHLYGQSCNMSRIMEIARKHNLFVVEDNAQSHFAEWEGKLTGTFGNINATSFYPGKNLGAIGDGGGITTDSEVFASAVKVLRNYGSHKKYYNEVLGFNSRLDELQAAILSVKLRFIKQLNSERAEIAKKYSSLLSDCENIILPVPDNRSKHVFHLYVIQCEDRDDLQQYLSKNDISTMIHYPVPPHLQEAYRFLGYKKGAFPLAEKIAERCLSLPLFPGMTDTQIEKVSYTIKAYFQEK